MWGDGKQTRSFTYIDDCVEGILRITKSDCREPLNLGSSEMVCTPPLPVAGRVLACCCKQACTSCTFACRTSEPLSQSSTQH